jgi:hypothetical protein
MLCTSQLPADAAEPDIRPEWLTTRMRSYSAAGSI